LEHIQEPVSSLIENLKNIQLRSKKRIISFSNYIGYCEIINPGIIKCSDILVDHRIELLNKNKLLCVLVSNRLRAKLFFRVLMW
jgi:DNA-directed RNA polymerase alpha subunit